MKNNIIQIGIIILSILMITSCGKEEPTTSCSDGILNGSEVGVDCGGPDCTPCATCFDNIQNGTETGIDCGGNECPACATAGCTNVNAHNYNPLATVDDGSCETCVDGIQNGDETGLDCGGVLCNACETLGCTDPNAHNYNPSATQDDGSCETCTDGIQNGDETGLDCGGVLCEPCYSIGQSGPGNGVVFYDKGNYNDGWRYLEMGVDIQNGTESTWGCFNSFINNTSQALGAGFSNTQNILDYFAANGCLTSPNAAEACANFQMGGVNDWFLPSVNELKQMFEVKDEIGLGNGRYWSSTESNAEDAYVVDFIPGGTEAGSYTYFKVITNGTQGISRIKPIRRF